MFTSDRTYRAPRLGVAALLCLGTFAVAPAPLAHAEPGNGAGQGQQQDPGQGNPGEGNPGEGNKGEQPSTSTDPVGNNGTVKIAPLGDFDPSPTTPRTWGAPSWWSGTASTRAPTSSPRSPSPSTPPPLESA